MSSSSSSSSSSSPETHCPSAARAIAPNPLGGSVFERVALRVPEPQHALRVLQAHRREQRGSGTAFLFLFILFGNSPEDGDRVESKRDAVDAVDGFPVFEEGDDAFVAVQRTPHDVALSVRHAAAVS
jgi:hypothetical protein